jgi:hypothetical protein
MPKRYKFLVGLAASLAAGWISHGPLGGGEAFIQSLETGVQAIVADAEITGVTGRVQREPLARTAILSGPADRFQREGQGSFPGLDERILAVPGIARLEWTNPPP